MIRILAVLALSAAPALAETVTKPSPYSVTETTDRLAAAVEDAGATVIARVPHGESAASVDMELPEAQLLIFGNPKVGTPVMQQDLQAGLVLPLRVLVHETEDGTALTYQTAETLFMGMDVDLSSEAVTKLDGALGKLTDKAVTE